MSFWVKPSTLPTLINRSTQIFTNYVLSTHKPLLASFKLTYRCNLRCQPCPFHTMQSSELSYRQVNSILKQLYLRGNRLLVIEGGEPLLWRDGEYSIHDVINSAKEQFFSVGITTNGTMPLDVPSDILWVSIDGFADTHNRLRGVGVFERVMENVLVSRHPKLYAHITVNSQNDAEVPDLIEYLDRHFRGITLQFYYPYNRQDDLYVDFDRREALLEKIIRQKQAGRRVMNSIACLEALKRNTWRCRDSLVDCANPDGSISQGCYLKSRTDIDCGKCGFSPHTEISLACQGIPGAIWNGMKIFLLP